MVGSFLLGDGAAWLESPGEEEEEVGDGEEAEEEEEAAAGCFLAGEAEWERAPAPGGQPGWEEEAPRRRRQRGLGPPPPPPEGGLKLWEETGDLLEENAIIYVLILMGRRGMEVIRPAPAVPSSDTTDGHWRQSLLLLLLLVLPLPRGTLVLVGGRRPPPQQRFRRHCFALFGVYFSQSWTILSIYTKDDDDDQTKVSSKLSGLLVMTTQRFLLRSSNITAAAGEPE